MKYSLWFLLLITAGFVQSSLAGNLYLELKERQKCEYATYTKTQLNCTYSAGEKFKVSIAGVGQSDAGILFNHSVYGEDYYGKFGLLHGCIIVTSHDFIDMAFISPRDGNIYLDWDACARSLPIGR